MDPYNYWQQFQAVLKAAAGNSKVPAFWIIFFFASLPSFIEYFSRAQELADMLQFAGEPEYLRNMVEEYDYIIIGGGSAGAVVANRLSADGKKSILVLEGGGDPNPFTSVPSLYTKINQPSTDYAYKIVKQNNACLAYNQKNCEFTRGKGLGGTSNLNAMNYVRGNRMDFDNWATTTGDTAWSYDSVLKMFKKSEDYHGHYEALNSSSHGQGGELYISEQESDTALNYLFQALQEKNFKQVDMNDDQQEGYGYLDQTIKFGRRWGTYQAFIEPALSRSNLCIYRYARALKIHFNKALKAIGVTYLRHGTTSFVRVRQEILLCAGTIDSPRLLMLSGIGPKEHLESVGISPVLVDLPVGNGLEDHLGIRSSVSINQTLGFAPERDITFSHIQNYLNYGTGPFSRIFHVSIGLGFSSSSETNNTKWPDLEYMFSGGAFKTSNGTYGHQLNVMVWLMRPKSSGEVKLESNNPNDPPVIDPKYLTHPSDISRLVEGIEFTQKIFDANVLKSLDPKISPNKQIPGCETIPFKTRRYWECYIRQLSETLCHPTGTCRMGSGKHDTKAVVDSKLRVLGTTGLRVIDASVIPHIPTGHTNAAAIMIGEMGSKFILQGN